MDQKKFAITAKRMTDARAKLIRDNPFFGQLAMGLQLACGSCGTACTDGERLIFDPEFAEKLNTQQEMEFVILHEVLHCVLEHCTRGGCRDSNLYNVACDIVVNSTILEMWGLKTICLAGVEPMHLVPNGTEGRNYNAEEVYQMLLSDSARNPGNTYTFGSLVDRHDVWKGIESQDRIRDAWDRKIRNAAQSCPDGAALPSFMRGLIEKLYSRSKVNWRQLLHDFIQHDSFDYSFLPPDRRFSGEFILPAFNADEEVGSARDIWVCVDTSASISDEQLADVLQEVQDAIRQTELSGAVSFFDGEVTEPESFATVEDFKRSTPKGGGGTNYHVIFQYLQEKLFQELPKAILIFTDGYVWKWPEEAASLNVPVLWLICKDGNTDIPWGQVVAL